MVKQNIPKKYQRQVCDVLREKREREQAKQEAKYELDQAHKLVSKDTILDELQDYAVHAYFRREHNFGMHPLPNWYKKDIVKGRRTLIKVNILSESITLYVDKLDGQTYRAFFHGYEDKYYESSNRKLAAYGLLFDFGYIEELLP